MQQTPINAPHNLDTVTTSNTSTINLAASSTLKAFQSPSQAIRINLTEGKMEAFYTRKLTQHSHITVRDLGPEYIWCGDYSTVLEPPVANRTGNLNYALDTPFSAE